MSTTRDGEAGLTVAGRVVAEMIALAALEVPGVLAARIERLLGLEVGQITAVVDGVGS